MYGKVCELIIPFHVSEMLSKIRIKLKNNAELNRMNAHQGNFKALRPNRNAGEKSINRFWDRLFTEATATQSDKDLITDAQSIKDAEIYSPNIENYIGTVKMPVGVIGPLRVNGLNASGDYHVPMATTEAALIASYARGAYATTKSGGVSAAVLYEGVIRTPAFVFDDLLSAGMFVEWVVNNVEQLQASAQSTTRYGKLVSVEPAIENNIVFLICRYTTGDASGQNMVTIATDALCKTVINQCPIKINEWYIEGNFSGDKKASTLGLLTGRGRKVSASTVLSAEVVVKYLGTTVEKMLDYARVANLGSHLSGQLGSQAHYANGLAAIYIATGQDAATVAESAVGLTRMEARGNDLFCSVTMPNILVGSVGGGTNLPSQSAGLNIMGLRGEGNAAKLAEVVAAACLCGEISIVAAISAGHFTRAHEKLARHR